MRRTAGVLSWLFARVSRRFEWWLTKKGGTTLGAEHDEAFVVEELHVDEGARAEVDAARGRREVAADAVDHVDASGKYGHWKMRCVSTCNRTRGEYGRVGYPYS